MKKLLLIPFFFFFSYNLAYSQTTAEKQQVIQTLKTFHQSIVSSSTETASQLLTESARILEGGNIETKKEYLSHHFHADGKFLSAMEREIESRTVFMEGNVAWVTTKSRLHGNYNGSAIDLTSLELAVLKKVGNQWKIAALHWSSSVRD